MDISSSQIKFILRGKRNQLTSPGHLLSNNYPIQSHNNIPKYLKQRWSQLRNIKEILKKFEILRNFQASEQVQLKVTQASIPEWKENRGFIYLKEKKVAPVT